MPVEVGFWRLGDQVERIEYTRLETESRLEDILASDVSILDPNLFVIGRQVRTVHGKLIDLLAIDADGKLIVIELKRHKTPRDVVAQALDYGSWIRTLEAADIASIYSEFVQKYAPDMADSSLDAAFRSKFGVSELPDTLNDDHELVIVASELDSSTERIVQYLTDEYGVAINVVFFRVFTDRGQDYLSRVWLIDPGEAEAKTVEKRGKEPWNGEFYVSFGEGPHRDWVDARKYGFISAGGGNWYSKTLHMLEPGNRVWVNVPGKGYVGVGRVTAAVIPFAEFEVRSDSGDSVAISKMPVEAPSMSRPGASEEEQEYLVGIEWLKTVPLDRAIKEKGFFGNQNSVAKPRNKKWIHTVKRLRIHFEIED